MGSFVAETWIHATAMVESPTGQTGTGFFVRRTIGAREGHIFLVTNKHLLGKDPEERRAIDEVAVWINVTKGGRTAAGRFIYSGIRTGMVEHPNADVDILAIDVTSLIDGLRNHAVKWVGYGDFATPEVLREEDITVGDEVMVIGYPAGLVQGRTAYPLVRQGIIATRIGERVVEAQPEGPPKLLPAFCVDGGAVPSSSGSPVVLKPVSGRHKRGRIVLATAVPYLLGIIASTAPMTAAEGAGRSGSLAGLGLAFDAVEIRNAIEHHYHGRDA